MILPRFYSTSWIKFISRGKNIDKAKGVVLKRHRVATKKRNDRRRKKNFNFVAKKEEGVTLEKTLAMKLNMMNQLESQGKAN